MEKVALIQLLESFDKQVGQGPWNEEYMQAGIRHMVRNWEWSDDCDDRPDEYHTPGMLSGSKIAQLRNALPEIIKHLKEVA